MLPIETEHSIPRKRVHGEQSNACLPLYCLLEVNKVSEPLKIEFQAHHCLSDFGTYNLHANSNCTVMDIKNCHFLLPRILNSTTFTSII